MPRAKGTKTVYFSKVKEAREALKDKALELFEQYQSLIRDAIDAGQFETASKGLQFLMEHMPKDEDGVALLEPSVDKTPSQNKGNSGPVINIGVKLGGVTDLKALAQGVEVIDIETEP